MEPKIKNNTSALNQRLLYEGIYGKRDMILMKADIIYEFSDGKYNMNKPIAVAYHVVELKDFNHFRVRINDPVPIITNEKLEQIRNTGKKVFIVFDDLTVLIYINQEKWSIEESYRAAGIKILGQND